jgi:hypothetical protein
MFTPGEQPVVDLRCFLDFDANARQRFGFSPVTYAT